MASEMTTYFVVTKLPPLRTKLGPEPKKPEHAAAEMCATCPFLVPTETGNLMVPPQPVAHISFLALPEATYDKIAGGGGGRVGGGSVVRRICKKSFLSASSHFSSSPPSPFRFGKNCFSRGLF